MKQAVLIVVVLALSGCAGSKSQNSAQPQRASEINLELGIDYLRKGDLKTAKDKIDRAVQQNPRNAMAQATAGLLYQRLGETSQANSYFERAVALDPKNSDILNNYAVFLCQQNRFDRGEKYALQSAANPLYKSPERGYFNAGNCARSAGNLARAEEHYRRALAVRAQFSPALYEMAHLEFRQNNLLSARAFLERYLEVSRADAAVLWLGVQIERGLGNANAASEYAQRLRLEYPSAAETKALLESERTAG